MWFRQRQLVLQRLYGLYAFGYLMEAASGN